MKNKQTAKPDFTGTWKFNPGRSVLQIPAPDSTIFVVEHVEPFLRLSRTHSTGDQSDTFALDLTIGGKEVVIVHGDLLIRARAYWEGDTLIFDSHILRGVEESTNVVRYKLARGGDSFVAEERFRSKGQRYDNVWMMDKFRISPKET